MDQPSDIIKSGPSITDRMGGLVKNYNDFIKGKKVNGDLNTKTKYNNPVSPKYVQQPKQPVEQKDIEDPNQP